MTDGNPSQHSQIILLQESCIIPDNDTLFSRYHDEEWGVPARNSQTFFEKICLEGFQSGLSWQIVLHKRSGLRQAFDDFEPSVISDYDETDINRLMSDKRIIRNRRKIVSVVNNARRFIEFRGKYGSLAQFIWSFEPVETTRPPRITRQWLRENPFTAESTALSKALKARGWTFVGPTNLYALMQAMGIVNDHVEGCPRRAQIERLRRNVNFRTYEN